MRARRTRPGAAGLAVLWVFGSAGALGAQGAPPPRHLVEVSGSATWTGAVSFGASPANFTAPNGSPLTYFNTTNRLTSAVGLDVRAAISLTPTIWAELTGAWRRPTLETRVTGDFEGAPDTTLTQPTSQFSLEGSVVWCFARRGRLEPFVRAGVGWLRQITADRELAKDAGVANVGGGVKYWWRDQSRGVVKRLGLRLELGAVVRSGGIALSAKSVSMVPAVAGGFFFGF